MDKKLFVSSIQHFSVGDGDGIRTTIFLKGCNLRCAWCHNPETILALPQVLKFSNGMIVHSGQFLSVSQILEEVLADIDFYNESGGGVTFSGGEAMLQAKQVGLVAEKLQKNNISVFVDTAGNVDYKKFEIINPFVNEYLYDIKAGNEQDYKSICGSIDVVTSNLKNLILDKKNVTVRIPLIPNFNTSKQKIEEICKVLFACNAQKINLLPFHKLGSGKYSALEKTYPYANVQLLKNDEIEKIAEIYRKNFDVVKIEK